MRRNGAVDLYRVMAMLGIVMLHVIAFTGLWSKGRHVGYLLATCVNGFALISGYFGIKFSWRKIVSLYCIAVVCLCISILMSSLMLGNQWSAHRFAVEAIAAFKEYWFLHCYVFLACVAPVVDRAMKGLALKDQVRLFFPFLCLIFLWGGFRTIAVVASCCSSSGRLDCEVWPDPSRGLCRGADLSSE